MARPIPRRAVPAVLSAAALLVPVAVAEAEPDPYEYSIVAAHSEKCVDVLHGHADDEAEIVQWSCDGRLSQIFSAAPMGSDEWAFWSQGTDKCLDASIVAEGGGDVVQRACDGGPSQRWRVEGEAERGYRIVSAVTGLCMEVEYASAEDGAQIRQFSCHGQNNQLFSFDHP